MYVVCWGCSTLCYNKKRFDFYLLRTESQTNEYRTKSSDCANKLSQKGLTVLHFKRLLRFLESLHRNIILWVLIDYRHSITLTDHIGLLISKPHTSTLNPIYCSCPLPLHPSSSNSKFLLLSTHLHTRTYHRPTYWSLSG